METSRSPPRGGAGGGGGSSSSSSSIVPTVSPSDQLNVGAWSRIERLDEEAGNQPCPCQRSLHVAAVLRDCLYIFGGYDGSNRVNDFYEYNFLNKKWSLIEPNTGHPPPSPRDRHVAVVYNNSFYVFGGFDGTSRVNDFYEYSFDLNEWKPVVCLTGSGPTPRHSHAAVVHGTCMYVFGGYDGSYRSDFHAFNFANSSWSPVPSSGRPPRARYRATCCVKDNQMFLFGGHDGAKHLNDVNLFHFERRVWSTLQTEGPAPIPRDSHVAVIHHKSMYVFGGSTGSAMDDLHELKLDTLKWNPVQTSGGFQPGPRFCHVAAVYKNSMFVFGGYDGSSRLNDFLEFKFWPGLMACEIPESTLLRDLQQFVNSELLSDITFLVEGRRVHAHKILCMRCTYFRALLTGEMKESREREIELHDVRYPIFVALMEYLYTDEVAIDLDIAMELFQAADRFGVERLKRMCESKMLASISIENAASIFHAADVFNATSLREKCLNFILQNFDSVTKTATFEEMGRTNMDLVFEILKKLEGDPPLR